MTSIFLVVRRDNPASQKARQEHLDAHMRYAQENQHRFLVGGAIRNDPNAEAIGSAMIVKGESIDDVREFAESDPFARAGVYESTEISYFQAGIGEWIAGETS